MSAEVAAQILGDATPPPAAPAPGGEAPPVPQQANETDADFAVRMAHLAKREKALVDRQQQIKSIEDELKPWKTLESRAKAGDVAAAIEALERLGISYDQLTQFQIEGMDPAKQQFASLKQEIDALKAEKQTDAERAQAEAQERAAQNYKLTIAQEAKANAEKYDLVSTIGGQEAIDLAYEVCRLHYERTNQMMAISDALEKVEGHLASKMETTVQSWKQSKKLSSYFAPQPSQAPNPFQAQPSVQSPALPKPTPQPTLSGGSAGATSANAAVKLSMEERRAAAIKALSGG